MKILVKDWALDKAFAAMLMKWNHTSDFNVDNSVRIGWWWPGEMALYFAPGMWSNFMEQ